MRWLVGWQAGSVCSVFMVGPSSSVIGCDWLVGFLVGCGWLVGDWVRSGLVW